MASGRGQRVKLIQERARERANEVRSPGSSSCQDTSSAVSQFVKGPKSRESVVAGPPSVEGDIFEDAAEAVDGWFIFSGETQNLEVNLSQSILT